MSLAEMTTATWKPDLPGWSGGILEFYEDIAKELPSGARCVELGVFCGRSLAWLHECMRRLGKVATFTGVDLWPNESGFGGFDEAMSREHGVFTWSLAQFLRHAPEQLRDIRIVRWESNEAARLFYDNSVDFLFVDAAHDYEHVRQDLGAWLPKVRAGRGIFAGHDYDPAEYPGVVRAVDETFRGAGVVVQNPGRYGSCWRIR